MNPDTPILLAAVWSWVSGVCAVAMLGLLLPVTVAMGVAFLPLAVRRHDWRELLQLLLPVGLFLVAGLFALTRVTRPAPSWDFWVLLSAQLGTIAFVVAVAQFGAVVRRRLRRDRLALDAVSGPLPVEADRVVGKAEPGPRRRLSGIEAEYYIADWMRFLGAPESVVTPARRDGGVDVRSRFYVAQVKHRPGDYVSVESVRALAGVAAVEGRAALFFASGIYSRDCYAFAREAGVALFLFQPREGRLVAANALASRLRASGLGAPAARMAHAGR